MYLSVLLCAFFFLAVGSYWIIQYYRNYSYSEEVYNNLQEEAERMIENKDFASEYYFSINGYDNKSCNFRLEIFDSNTSFQVRVVDFGKPSQMMEYRKFSEEFSKNIINGILATCILSVLVSILIYEVALKPCIYVVVILFHILKKSKKSSLEQIE